jgi:hypothetical protein
MSNREWCEEHGEDYNQMNNEPMPGIDAEPEVLDPEEPMVPMFQLMQWKYAIKLEMQGMKNSRGSVYAHAKRVLGIKGNRQKVYDYICETIEDLKYENHIH